MSLENENMNESQAREAARREYIEKFTWHDDAVIAAYVEENWRRFASEKPAMTDIKPVTDERIKQLENWLSKGDGEHMVGVKRSTVLSLIARIRAETEWQPIETAPHACTFLATYWSDDFGEWTVGLVMRPLDGPWTHWRPLPTPPALSQEERT